jgi:hypothetical protein
VDRDNWADRRVLETERVGLPERPQMCVSCHASWSITLFGHLTEVARSPKQRQLEEAPHACPGHEGNERGCTEAIASEGLGSLVGPSGLRIPRRLCDHAAPARTRPGAGRNCRIDLIRCAVPSSMSSSWALRERQAGSRWTKTCQLAHFRQRKHRRFRGFVRNAPARGTRASADMRRGTARALQVRRKLGSHAAHAVAALSRG